MKGKIFTLAILLMLFSCTVSLIYIKNSEYVEVNKRFDTDTDLDLQKKDSVGISLIKNKY